MFTRYRKPEIGEAWQCPTCGLMITYGHVCKIREVVQCPDCKAMLEKGLESKHWCTVKQARIKAEKKARAAERRAEKKEKGLVSYIQKLPEKESMTFMEAMLNGGYEPYEVEKYPWKCKICGNVWQSREEAERCPYAVDNPFCPRKEPHANEYFRLYGVQRVVNGAPWGHYLRKIRFAAMRTEESTKLPEGKKWDVVPDERYYGHSTQRTELVQKEAPEFDDGKMFPDADDSFHFPERDDE